VGERSPRRGRLTRSADFDRVMRSGRSHAGPELVLYVFPRGSDGPPRLGLSVSRKVGGAVERNTVKRMLREAFAQESDRLPVGSDAVVIARNGAGELAERDGPRRQGQVVRIARLLVVGPIRLYQRLVSPAFGQRCRYYPSCSEYAAQAITRFGILRGLVLAVWRLLRCNPWSQGGFDPVEDQRLFKPRTPATTT
jgi:putative membrane protein insertion efficiency factor/ribonuclease P protein component